ncbi:glycosyltransferase family 4 protein [Microbacterium enclense]|uniref:glycosyltransferase family 4 protein n=1 Tax=Microbacterium enclense TaxID=993073 RepID=UPI003F7DE2EB
MKKNFDAAYATNVRHYSHVLLALSREWNKVGFIGPNEIDPRLLRRVEGVVPAGFAKILRRRVATPLPPGIRRVGFTHAANLPSVNRVLTGRSVTPSQIASIHTLQARQVVRSFSGVDYLQTVEGLAHQALRRRSAKTIVVERRNLHHEVFEAPLETYSNFPFRTRRDPIRDLLMEEYAQADRIVVYSEVARQSFLERGVPDEKLWVSPLPVRGMSPAHQSSSRRNPHQLLYVGRLDAYKGIDVAVAVIEALGSPWKLVVAGPGGQDERDWLTARPHVEYRGVLDQTELRTLYDTSAALLSPSVESFGLAVLEATRAGIPVLVRETTGVKDYLPMGAARVIPTRSPEVWRAAVEDGFDGLGNAWHDDNYTPLEYESAVDNQSRLIDDVHHRGRSNQP